MHIINAGPAQDEEQVFRLKVSLNLELGIVACHLLGGSTSGNSRLALARAGFFNRKRST